MHPILAQIGSFPIHTYGFMTALGFICAVQIIQYLAGRSGLNRERIQDLIFATLIIGFIGARFVFVLTRFSDFAAAPLDIFKVWEGGLVFYGGPLFGAPFVYWFTRHFKLPLWKTGDALMPGLVIAHAFGRLGCLAAGCCYGKPTGSNYGIVFNSELVEESLRGIHLHPTQLYEFTALIILFTAMLFVWKRKRFDGQVVLVYFLTYPVIRSIVEVFRGDTIRGFVIDGVLSTSQFISAIVFVVAFFVLQYRLKQVNQNE